MGTPSTFLAAVASFADYANVLHRILRNKNRKVPRAEPVASDTTSTAVPTTVRLSATLMDDVTTPSSQPQQLLKFDC